MLIQPLFKAMPVEAPTIPNLVGWNLTQPGHAVDGHLMHPEIASHLPDCHYRLVLTIGRHHASSRSARFPAGWPPPRQTTGEAAIASPTSDVHSALVDTSRL
jgi:hypothetical protein